MSDERYIDCERCGERFVGSAIRGYLRETAEGTPVCISCIQVRTRKRAAPKDKAKTRDKVGA